MKHVSLSRVLLAFPFLIAFIFSGSGSWAQSNPAAFTLSTGPYSFTGWPATSTAGTYPANMVFHFVGLAAPTTATPSSGDYICAYNLTTRSRINGKGDDGIGFIGTSDPRFDNCISGTASTTRYVGDAVLGLNTTGRQTIQVGWTGGTSTAGARTWGLQLQYRIGTSSSFTNVAGTSLYTSTTAGNTQVFAPVTLPVSVENQNEVQLRWIYYEISGSGTRPEIRLDEITVTSVPILPDLGVSLTGPASAMTGQPFTYSLVVSNTDNAPATNVPISFTLPAGVSYVSATETDNFTATHSSGVVSFTDGTVSANSSATLTVTVSSLTEGTVSALPGAAVVDEGNTITESNEANNSSIATVITTVGSANQPPIAPSIPGQTGVIAVPFSYTVPAFTDPESQTLAYAITGVAAGLSADNTTRIISGTPTATGSLTVTVVATDPEGDSATATFGISINGNQPPVASSVSNQTTTAGTSFSYVVPAFSDPESQTLLYAVTSLPNGLSFAASTRTISGIATTAATYSITITATDPANNTATATFTLQVNPAPPGSIRITEYMYSRTPGEYFELTNTGNTPINLTGWSFDDNSRLAGAFTLSSLGIVQPGESVIVTEADAATFRRAWYLPASVKVLGGSLENLSRSDEINIYNTSATLVDRLTFNDQGIPNSVRTNDISGWTAPANLSLNQATTYQLSVVGDAQNSYSATTGNVGNPGGYYVPLNRVLVVESGSSTTVVEGGATDSYTVKLNSQPVADVIVSINPGSQFSVSPMSLTFTPASYSNIQTATVTAIDDNVVEGTHTAQITQSTTSTDPAYNGIATNSVSVTITDKNTPPTVAQTISSQTATVGVAYSFTVPAATFTDAQTPNNLTLSVAGLPTGLSFTAPNSISGTPSTTVGSPFSVTVIATDPGNLSGSTTFLLTVNPPPNTPPTVAQTIGSQSATLGVTYTFTIPSATFTDAETPNDLTLVVSGLPAGLSFTAPNAISGTPSTTVGSPFTVTVAATDPGGLTVSTTFQITVNNTTTCVNMFTIKTGNWNDSAVWSCGRLPVNTDKVVVNHVVTLPVSYTANALRVTFSPTGRLIHSSGSKLRLN